MCLEEITMNSAHEARPQRYPNTSLISLIAQLVKYC